MDGSSSLRDAMGYPHVPLVAQPLSKFNLSQAVILLLEPSVAELDLYGQMLFGFGAKFVHRCQTRGEARKTLATEPVDLVIVDAKLGREDKDGYDYVRALRRSGDANAFLPVIMITGHTPGHQVTAARDSGVHFVVRKPVSAGVLLERILWIAQEARPFIESPGFVGPDHHVRRLAAKLKSGADMSVTAALRSAMDRLQALERTIVAAIEAELSLMDALAARVRDGETGGLTALYESSDRLVGLAALAPRLDGFATAAFSLCDVIDGLERAVPGDMRAIELHISALRALSDPTALERHQLLVLGGLAQLRAHFRSRTKAA